MALRELTSREIIRAGHAYEACRTWERARAFAWALYGPSAAHLTYSQTTFPEQDHRLHTVQALAFDSARRLMPYDFTATWWSAHDLPAEALTRAWDLTRDDLAVGLGSAFPKTLRDDLRAFAEESLGVETFHTWLRWNETDTLTWMFDLLTPPPLPYVEIASDSGVPLTNQDIIAAGLEREELIHWSGVRKYVRTLYGERAAKANVIKFSRYNDNTYDRDIRLDVFGADGSRLFFDLRLPWWERFAFSEQNIAKYAKYSAKYIEEHDSNGTAGTEEDPAFDWESIHPEDGAIQRLATELLGADFIETGGEWAADTSCYDLTQPPPLRFPRLWAQDGA